jgi:preprotein translocase subunit SecF
MEFFKIRRDIPFMKNALIFNAISFITFALAVFFIATRGLHFSIEFTGGTVMEVAYAQSADIEKVRKVVEGMGYTDSQVQNFGTAKDVLIRLPIQKGVTTADQADKVLAALKASDPSVERRRVEFVGPQVGDELAKDGALALLFVVLGIMAYLAIRFEWKFAVAAIIANLHDVIIILGFFAFFQWEFSLSVLAAVLAVLGYSVNESVVIFDRVREKFRERSAKTMTTPQVLDHAITSTISRTIITHGSTQIMPYTTLLCRGAHHRHFVRYLFVSVRCRSDCDVARC